MCTCTNFSMNLIVQKSGNFLGKKSGANWEFLKFTGGGESIAYWLSHSREGPCPLENAFFFTRRDARSNAEALYVVSFKGGGGNCVAPNFCGTIFL